MLHLFFKKKNSFYYGGFTSIFAVNEGGLDLVETKRLLFLEL